MASVTQKDLHAALWGLADLTKDEIADKVSRTLGDQKSVCSDPSKCAIANYVTKVLGLDANHFVSVGSWSSTIGRLDSFEEEAWVEHPPAVGEFIRAFDEGEYPELIAA